MSPTPTHTWRFARAGGFDQVRLDTAEDLARLDELDLKLWAALACPVKGLEFDERTLALIDTDKDGRVRAPEILAAVGWCDERLKDLAAIKAGTGELPLAQIDDSTDAGRAVLASARQILKDLGKGSSAAISLADVSDTARIFAQTRFNGDGILPANAADDEPTRKVIEDILACCGSLPDRSGQPGIDQARLDDFFTQLAACEAWVARGESDPALRPLGEATAAAAAAVQAVRAKVDDWFARSRLAEFDERALEAVNRSEAEYLGVAAADMTITAQEVAGFPLARVRPGQPLSLTTGVNPAWAAALETLRTAVVAPLAGKDKTALTAADWSALVARLAPYEAWMASRPTAAVAGLPPARVREILAGPSRKAIADLIARDKALEKEAQGIAQVEQLVRLHRDFYRLLLNFVSFDDFYSGERKAIFQAGTLYLDARACELCLRVDDPARHAALAGMSKAYLAYCDCTRPSGEKLQIVAAFTGGDSDYLMVGRNGLFFDRKGRDWDATITKVVENPISVRQAFWAPYKKAVRLIDELVAKRAAASSAESDAKLAAVSQSTADAGKPATPPPEPKKIDVGTVAALGVAFGAIGTLIATLIGYAAGLFSLPFWIIILALLGLMLLISGPFMVIAWLKLRQRNMGPILDANGWAVNGRVKLSVRFGESLTEVAKLPPGSKTAGADPYADKPSPWPRLLLVVVIVAFIYSFLGDPAHGWLYDWTRPGTAFHEKLGFSLGSRKLTEEEQAAMAAPQAPAEAATPAPAPAAPPVK
ncbi:MAG TPA: hypothetical protein VFY71_04555 [Planctomycetota bacterium]|nr:hypothetical protein [Planctomycetota bacterium]